MNEPSDKIQQYPRLGTHDWKPERDQHNKTEEQNETTEHNEQTEKRRSFYSPRPDVAVWLSRLVR
jgi:hypothetical protein